MLLALLLPACGGAPPVAESLPPAPSSTPAPVTPAPEPEAVVLDPLPLALEVSALTGLPRAEGMLDGQRPVAVMVSNNERSLPQRGLAAADVLVEMLTEGGITRLMAMYDDYRAVPQVGPVRSTRDQFVQFALPADAIMAHIGTSVYARNLLDVTAYKTVDGLYLGRTAYWFDQARSNPKPGGKLNEYCWFTDAGLLWAGMEYVDVHPTGTVRTLFNFVQGQAPGEAQATWVNLTFSATAEAGFVLNAETGLYDKSIFGAAHTDEDGAQLSYTNLFVLACDITLKPDGLCTEFDMREGRGWYFMGGAATEVLWQKGNPEDALRLFTNDGKELEVQPGKSYIGYVPAKLEGAVRYGAQ